MNISRIEIDTLRLRDFLRTSGEVRDYLTNDLLNTAYSSMRKLAKLQRKWLCSLTVIAFLGGCKSPTFVEPHKTMVAAKVTQGKSDHKAVYWTIINKSQQYLVYDRLTTPAGLLGPRFEVHLTDDTVISYRGLVADSLYSESAYNVLAPRSQSTVEVQLSKYYQIPDNRAFKVRCQTFFKFGFYRSEASAKSAIHRLGFQANAVLPHYTNLDTGWVSMSK